MNAPIPASTPASSDLEQQVAALQRQVFLLLVALNVVAATLVFYFFYESHVANIEYNDGRGRAIQIIDEYQKNALSIQKFDQELGNYGTTHRDFQPILKKYGWPGPSGSSTSTPAEPRP